MASFGVALGPFGSLWVTLGALWLPLGCPWAPFGSSGVALAPFGVPLGSLWGAIALPLGRPWLALGALGSLWMPLGSMGSLWELNVHRLRCLSTKSSLLEHAAGAAGAAEVVSRTRLGAHLPHAPGARMTVVTQTPSNYWSASWETNEPLTFPKVLII